MSLLEPVPREAGEWRRPARRAKVGAVAVVATASAGAATLIVVCLLDAGHRWEAPRWSERRFEAIGSGSDAWRQPGERWVVAAFPKCPHCRESLRDLAVLRARMTHPPRLAALIVDTPRRPPDDVLADMEVDAVFWDRDQVWRRRWGHRAYGEVLCFDAGGRYLRTRVASEIGADVPDP